MEQLTQYVAHIQPVGHRIAKTLGMASLKRSSHRLDRATMYPRDLNSGIKDFDGIRIPFAMSIASVRSSARPAKYESLHPSKCQRPEWKDDVARLWRQLTSF